VSLIADSLKKAVKEKSAPKWESDPEINPVGRRESIKRPGLSNVFRILLLIVLPTGILAYLIYIGAFTLKKTPVPQKPDSPVSVPVEEARVAPPSKPAPEVSVEKPGAVSPAKPSKKTSVEKATVALKTSDKTISRKKEKTVFKKVIPSNSRKKTTKKPKEALVLIPVIPDEKRVALSAPELQSIKPVVPKIPPVATEKKIPAAPLAPSTEKPRTEATPLLAQKLVAPLETPALKLSEAEIPDDEIAARPEPSMKPSVDPVLEEPQAPPEQKTPAPVVPEKKIPAAPLAPSTETPDRKSTPDLEQKEGTPEETPAISDAVKENPGKLDIEVQKKNPEVASLSSSPPPSIAKPEIFRVEPRDQENVFNNSDYYFNRGIFFQQARDWQKALVNYSKSEELDPNNPDTYNNKGVVLKEMGKFDKALDEFLRAIFLDAGYAKAYNNIGVVYYMQKNYPEAIRHYLKAIDINPTNLEAFNNLAIIYKKQKELDKARGVLNRALALNPDHPGTNYNLAVLYEENSEIKPALHFYRRFIELGAINYPSLVTRVKEHLAGMEPQ